MENSIIKVASPQVGEEEIVAVSEVLRSGQYMSGPKVLEFEQSYADYLGVNQCVAVNSGTAALHVALACLGVGPGDEVIVPALTFFSTVTAVIHQNAVPIFADISMENFSLDPADLEHHITPRTKAIIVVHYFGHAAEMDAIMEVAHRHDLFVIEDCAQAHGTQYKGQKVGSIAHMGAFSFMATKHITTGEGGAITTNNADWAELAKRIRSHGMVGRNDHVLLGYNYRMTEIAAAMGIVQLQKLDALNSARIQNANYLIAHLKDIRWAILPKVPDHVVHTYFWCHLLVDEDLLGFSTQELIKRLGEEGIQVRSRYVEPLYRQPLLLNGAPFPKGCPLSCPHYGNPPDYASLHLPNAEKVAGHVIGLPCRPDMKRSELDRVVDVLYHIS